jgi:hypothetical protein
MWDLVESGCGKELYVKIIEPFILKKKEYALSVFDFGKLNEREVYHDIKFFFNAVATTIKEENNVE